VYFRIVPDGKGLGKDDVGCVRIVGMIKKCLLAKCAARERSIGRRHILLRSSIETNAAYSTE
jgi:hypothetical protein